MATCLGSAYGTPDLSAFFRIEPQPRLTLSTFQPHLLMLALQRLLVSLPAFLIDFATDAFKDHGKSAAVALRRAIGVGAVDDFAVVDYRIAGLQMHRDFIGLVLGAVIGNALRKT